jgi:8-oxo-dGTP pyrophosphatase MutT (NUDIX family)
MHWRIVFTQRQRSLRHHGGQISFPGGRFEDGDTSLQHTALRETEEELGFPTEEVVLLGPLTPLFIAPSQNHVYPYVGWLPELPPISPNPTEVAAVLTLSLKELLSPNSLGVTHWRRNGEEMTAPCYRVGETIIWGATAMILSELLTVLHSVIHEGS